MAPQISLGEVKKHNNSESTWMVIHNDIYDVTTFLNEHPGGPDSLLEYAGLDGTVGFEEVGHSSDAREMMKKYKIGTLPRDERTKDIPKYRYTQPKSDYKAPSSARVERRVQSVVVPRERQQRRRPSPPPRSSNLKWAIMALAGALVIGFVLKKYMG